MKLNKKFLACFTAMTVMTAPMSVFADNPANNGNPANNADSYNITGIGTVDFLDTSIYNVILPTSNSVNFHVDPFGLTEVAEGTSLADIISSAAGMVTSSATAVINKSSVPINVNIGLLFDNSVASNSAVKLASTEAEAASGDADLYLAVQAISGAALEKTSVVTSGDAFELTGSWVDIAYTLSNQALTLTPSATGVDVTNGAVTVVTATNAAAYASSNSIDVTLSGVASAYFLSGGVAVLSEGAVTYTPDNVYTFRITGYANPKATVWEAIDNANSDLALTMKFTISQKPVTAPTEVPTSISYTSGTKASGVVLTFEPGTDAKTLATNYLEINGVVVSGWSTFASGVSFNNDNTITIRNSIMTASNVASSAPDSKYTITVKATDGTTYSTEDTLIN